jgi:hypothetical protein
MTDKLDTVLSSLRLTAGHGAPVLLAPAEALSLVAEIERLRAEVVALQERLDDYADTAFEAELCEEK